MFMEQFEKSTKNKERRASRQLAMQRMYDAATILMMKNTHPMVVIVAVVVVVMIKTVVAIMIRERLITMQE